MWWDIVRNAWERVPVTLFSDVTLADGTRGSDVDLNDLVWTDELVAAGVEIGISADRTFWFNSGYQELVSLLVTAAQGEPVGFSLGWTEAVERFPTCGIERWDPATSAWETLVDPAVTSVAPSSSSSRFPASQATWRPTRFPRQRPAPTASRWAAVATWRRPLASATTSPRRATRRCAPAPTSSPSPA